MSFGVVEVLVERGITANVQGPTRGWQDSEMEGEQTVDVVGEAAMGVIGGRG